METDSRQTSGSDAGAFPGFEDLKKLIEKFQLPSFDIDALIDWQRRDMRPGWKSHNAPALFLAQRAI